MSNNFMQQRIYNGINFNVIKDKRFKTGRLSITMFVPLNEKDASANAILPFLLSKSCNDYKDHISLNKHLDTLYGASIHADVSKLGETQVLSISAVFLDDRYLLDGDTISANITKLLCKMLFNPVLENGTFSKDKVEQEKRQLIELIESEFNDKRILAKNRCESLMFQNEKFGINRYGTRSQVEKLSVDDIFNAWKNVLQHAKIEITLLGNSKEKLALDIFKDEFSKIPRDNIFDCKTEIIKFSKSVKEHSDNMDVSQSKLVMGFRTSASGEDNYVMPMRVAIALFGSTPHSKLFMNVREKYSLCYYCSARYDRTKGIMMVQSGVEKDNIQKAKCEILNQLEEIKKGNFTNSEIIATKKSLSNSYRTVSDYLSSLENFYISQTFNETRLTPEEFVEKINAVTKEQIISAAKMITLDTIYTLIGN